MNVLRRWTLSTMRFTRRDGSDYTLIVADGPALQGIEQPEVVPADQLAGAVEALRWAMARVSPPEPDDPSPSAATFARAYAKAAAALDATGGR
jgi:hypothetical protein